MSEPVDAPDTPPAGHLSRRLLLQTTLGATALKASRAAASTDSWLLLPESEPVSRSGVFSNWTGNLRVRPAAVVRPETVAELQRLVGAARKVKPVGTGHSFTPCAYTDQTMLQTDALNRVLQVDRERRQVRVEAGIKLAALNEVLAAHGLALPSLGDVAVQSLAGAMATGTHGTGMAFGSFADAELVHGIELVLADGTLLQLDADQPRDQAALAAARLSLGALGVVYAVTLNLVPKHNLALASRLLPLSEALSPHWYKEHDHFEFFRFPFTEQVQAIVRDKTTAALRHRPVRSFIDKILLENAALGLLLNASALRPQVMPQTMRLIASMVPNQHEVRRSDQAMTSTRLVRAFELEYAVPIANAAAVQAVFGRLVADFAGRKQPAFFANFPSECRFVRADRGALLSPTQGQDCCWFSVASHVAFTGHEVFFRALETELLALGGRPHWGKHFYKNPLPLYPEFPAFAALRQRLDPGGKFLNIYLERLLSGAEMTNTLVS